MSSTNGRTLSLEQAAREQETIEALLARRRELRATLRNPVSIVRNGFSPFSTAPFPMAASEAGTYLSSYAAAPLPSDSGTYLSVTASAPAATALAGRPSPERTRLHSGSREGSAVAPWMRGPATAAHLRPNQGPVATGNIWTAQMRRPGSGHASPGQALTHQPVPSPSLAGNSTGNYLSQDWNPATAPPASHEELEARNAAIADDLALVEAQLKAHIRNVVELQKALSAASA